MTVSPEPRGTRGARRRWRAAVVLFLVVFLGGAGVVTANAVWSQSGAVSARVTTGSWSQDGWAWGPEGLTGRATPAGGYVDLVIGWQPPVGHEQATYHLAVDPSVIAQGTVKGSRPGTEPASWQVSLHKHLAGTVIPLTLTATSGGYPSAPVHLELVFAEDAQVTVRQVSGT